MLYSMCHGFTYSIFQETPSEASGADVNKMAGIAVIGIKRYSNCPSVTMAGAVGLPPETRMSGDREGYGYVRSCC